MQPDNFELLSDEELAALLEQNPKAAVAYTRIVNMLIHQAAAAPTSTTAAAPPAPTSSTKATPFPDLSTCTRIEATLWDNADENGKAPKHQTRYKVELKAWTIDCASKKSPPHQWARNLPVYERFPFTAKFEKLSLSDQYLQILNHLTDLGNADTHYAMLGDKMNGTNFYDRQVVMFNKAGTNVFKGLLVIGDLAVELPPWVRTQAGEAAKPLTSRIVAQSRWTPEETNWSTGSSKPFEL